MPQSDKIAMIEEAVSLLLLEANDKPPTVREISVRSGFGVGTIYDYFGSLNGLFTQLLLKKQQALLYDVKKMIDAHPPDIGGVELLDGIIDKLFLQVNGRNPKMLRFILEIALKSGKSPDDFNRAIDCLVIPMMDAQKRDRTGTLPVLDAMELSLLLRCMQSTIRSPLFEMSQFFGTTDHIEKVKSIGRRLFHQQERQYKSKI